MAKLISTYKALTDLAENTILPALTGARVSTRYPTAVKATEDPLADSLIIDVNAMRDSGKAYETNMATMAKYPQFKTGVRNPDKRSDYFQGVMEENLLDLHDRMPASIRDEAKEWYVGANRFASDLSRRSNHSMESVSGVIAAMSPQKDWYMNASLAERVIDIYDNPGNVTKEIADKARDIFKGEAYAADLAGMLSKPWEDLSRRQKAMYIRAKDEAENFRGHRIMSPSGELQDWARTASGEPKKTNWGSLPTIEKAISVLDDPSIENISASMGGQHKVRNFYNNIADPFSPMGDVTIDTHAVAADLVSPYSGSSVPVEHNFGGTGSASSALTGAKGTYGLHADAYRAAAGQVGVLPRELQSITWEGVRGLFPAKFKQNKKNIAEIDRIWESFSRGDISLQQARDEIIERAGGIDTPDWAAGRHDPGINAGTGSAYDQRAMDRAGVSGPTADGVDGGAGVDGARGVARSLTPAAALGAVLLGYMTPEQAEAGVVSSVARMADNVLGVLKSVDTGSAFLGAEGRTFISPVVEAKARIYDGLREQKNRYGEPVFDASPIPGGSGQGATGLTRYSVPGEYAERLQQVGVSTPDLIELKPGSAASDQFFSNITEAKRANRFGASVYVYPKDEYNDMRLFLTEDGSAGYALKPDGDIVSAFSKGVHKGIAPHLILHGIESGGKKLDAFDTVLPDLYSQIGFREGGRLRWDDAEAPADWDKGVFSAYNSGEPDVSFMGQSPAPAIPVEPRYVDEYGDAVSAQEAIYRQGGMATPEAIAATALAGSIATYAKQRESRKPHWESLKQDVLSIIGKANELAGEVNPYLDIAIDTPLRAAYGATGFAGSLAAGEGLDAAVEHAKRDFFRDSLESGYEMGGAVTDATGSPAAGAAVMAVPQVLSPI